MSDRLDHVPEGVRARIERGEVPPPRVWTDAPDPIRDVRYAVAVAEDEGNWDAVNRYNAQWMNLIREGHDKDTWQPPADKRFNPYEAKAPTKSGLVDAARKAEEAGDHEAANALKLKAQGAHEDVDPGLQERARELEDQLKTAHELPYQEREALIAEHMRVNGRMLAQMRGDPEPRPSGPPPEPLTHDQIVARRDEAYARAKNEDDVGIRRQHIRESDRMNLMLLAEQRQRLEPTFASNMTDPDNAA